MCLSLNEDNHHKLLTLLVLEAIYFQVLTMLREDVL